MLSLSGNNSFSNAGIAAGTLEVASAGALGSGGLSIGAGTMLRAGAAGLSFANAMSTAGAGTVDTSGYNLTLSGPIAGPGSLTKAGLGTLTLSGSNSFVNSGISGGTLAITSAAALGGGGVSIGNGTTLAALATITVANPMSISGAGVIDSGTGVFTLTGPIAGPGSLTKKGSGTLALSGSNSFSNAGISAGTLQVASAGALGTGGLSIGNGTTLQAGAAGLSFANAMSVTGAGIVDSNGYTLTLAGPIAGPGSLTKTGAGTLVLSGGNSYSNAGVSAGTLQVASAGALGSGGLSMGAGTTLQAGAVGLSFANAISTAGVGTIDTQAYSLTLSGPINGPGSIVKAGSGVLTLTGVSGYTGATSVVAGQLLVTGSIATSATTVASGATLSGTGTVGALTASAGSVVSPGAAGGAIATLNVAGNAVLAAGSAYVVDVTPASADLLHSSGTTTIAGNVAVAAAAGSYAFNKQYIILTASGGRSGTFASSSTLGSFGPAFIPLLSYDANNVYLRLAPNSLVALLGSTPVSSNVLNVATAFDKATSADFNPQSFYALYLQGANLPLALNQLSGEIHAVERRAAIGDTRYVREAALDRLGAGLCSLGGAAGTTTTDGKNTTETCNERYSLWGRYVGSWGTNQADGNGSHFKTSTNGVIVGIDGKFGDVKVGALFNYTDDKVVLDGLGESSVKSTGGGVYVGYRPDSGIAVTAGGAYAGTKFRSSRAITAPGLAQGLSTDARGNVGQLFGEISYTLPVSATVKAEPFARIGWVHLKADAFSEAGGYAAVGGGEQTYETTFTTLGARGSTTLSGGFGLRGSVGWQHASGDRSPAALLALQGTNSPASITGVAFDKDAAALEASAVYSFGAGSFSVGYNGVLGKNVKDNGVTATLSWGF